MNTVVLKIFFNRIWFFHRTDNNTLKMFSYICSYNNKLSDSNLYLR